MPKKVTILLAEDEKMVRIMIEAMLGCFGYNYISAVDGCDAVKKFRENKDSINLLLFDVNMPKKDGIAAYDEIKAITPDIKVIFSSGHAYVTEDVRVKLKGNKNIMWLPKPYISKQLIEIVKKMLYSEL